MPINQNLLIASPTLQDYLVDKDTGAPLSAGIVTFYKDTQRTVLKNWYIQQGNSPPYTYVPGPNPMQLTAVGTFSDQLGNDIIPYFYPYSETNQNQFQQYFITVYNSGGVLQFTREGFPFLNESAQPGSVVPTLNNYIINNVFWRNVNFITLPTMSSGTIQYVINGTTYYANTLSPSNHDGFAIPDFVVLKDILGATETITFQKFPAGSPANAVLQNDVTPEYYLEWNCSAFQSGQTLKCLQFPLQLHVLALENQEAVIVFHAKNNGAQPSSQIIVQILQYCGTGSVDSNFVSVQSFTIGDSWQKFVTNPFPLPNAAGLTLSSAGDDGLYVQFVFPPTVDFDIFFAKPQLYLSATYATNEYQTYDQVDRIIHTPRTGDVRMGINLDLLGWVPMNDGTIGPPSSFATTRANSDTWPLYNLMWNIFASNPANRIQIYSAFANPPVQPYSSNLTTFGASAIADWNANKSLSLPRSLGRSLSGMALGMPIGITFTTNSTNVITVTAGSVLQLYNGMPCSVTTYGGSVPPSSNITYYIKILSPTTFSLYYDSGLVNIVTITSSSTGSLMVPDNGLSAFLGLNFGDTSNTYETSFGYPAQVTTGVAAVGTRSPTSYANFYMKL